MWILSCDGDLFGGKRIWLRPGTTHLLGRTSGHAEGSERIRFIDHRSVSRKHLLVAVGPVTSGDSAQLHKRTELTLTDASKTGTTINGHAIVKEDKILGTGNRENVYTIKLGKYETVFKLEWKDVVFTCKNLTKKKAGPDTLEGKRKLFEGVDVKVLAEYVSNEATHLVGKKRNTAEALQALLQAKWVIGYGFMEALAKVTSRSGKDAGVSALEEDFDAHWPSEREYAIEAGSEPNPRPDEYLLPKEERNEVFRDYTFIFLAESQYNTLLPVVTSGGGKALLFEITNGENAVNELISYVREVAGKKGNDSFKLSQYTGKGGIVLVRTNEHGRNELVSRVEMELDQKGIEQNQFLDVILTMDTSPLRQRLPDAEDDLQHEDEAEQARAAGLTPPPSEPRGEQPMREAAGNVPGTASQPPTSGQMGAAEEEVEKPPPETAPSARPRWGRRQFRTKFPGFDDFDTSQFAPVASTEPEPSAQSLGEPSQAQSIQSMDIDEQSQTGDATQQSTRKRAAPTQEESAEDMYGNLLQGQAALKRRKTEAAKAGVNNTFSRAAVEADQAAADRAAKFKKKAEKQIDVKAELKARRDAEEERRKKDDEALKELEGIDVSELKDLVKIEEFKLPVRERPSRPGTSQTRSERWDPAWDGRKNFKKFRPQGQRRDGGARVQRVIVTLEEAPRRGHGMGEEYFLTSESRTAPRGNKSQSQSQTLRGTASTMRDDAGDDEADGPGFRRRIQRSREEDAAEAAFQAFDPAEIAGRPRDGTFGASAANGAPRQSLGTESQRKAAGKGKRPATEAVTAPPAKRAKQSSLRQAMIDDDDDDDELKFRRRRR